MRPALPTSVVMLSKVSKLLKLRSPVAAAMPRAQRFYITRPALTVTLNTLAAPVLLCTATVMVRQLQGLSPATRIHNGLSAA